jgi:hypothetical protein
MFYLATLPRPHYVSILTGEQYFFATGDNGADQLRALKQLERDDTPAPEPTPPPVQIVQPTARPLDMAAQTRMQLDEMKLEQLRRK